MNSFRPWMSRLVMYAIDCSFCGERLFVTTNVLIAIDDEFSQLCGAVPLCEVCARMVDLRDAAGGSGLRGEHGRLMYRIN